MNAILIAALLAQSIEVSEPTISAETVATDRPLAVEIGGGSATLPDGKTVLLPHGLFLNDKAAEKIVDIYNAQEQRVADLSTQNEALKKEVDRITADPPLDWKKALIIGLACFAVGAGAAASIAVVATKAAN